MAGSAGNIFAALRTTAPVLALAMATISARAETAAPAPPAPAAPEDSGNGRFAMTPVADGFLRLDTRTGQVSLCAVASGQVQCRAGADEHAALQAEIDRLAKENAKLKAAASPTATTDDEDERRFDRSLDRAERFMRRMMQLFRDWGAKPPSSL